MINTLKIPESSLKKLVPYRLWNNIPVDDVDVFLCHTLLYGDETLQELSTALESTSIEVLWHIKKRMHQYPDLSSTIKQKVYTAMMKNHSLQELALFRDAGELSPDVWNVINIMERDNLLSTATTAEEFASWISVMYDTHKVKKFKNVHPTKLAHIKKYEEYFGVKATAKHLLKYFEANVVKEWLATKEDVTWRIIELLDFPELISSHLLKERIDIKTLMLSHYPDEVKISKPLVMLNLEEWVLPITSIRDVDWLNDYINKRTYSNSDVLPKNVRHFLQEQAIQHGYKKDLDFMLGLNIKTIEYFPPLFLEQYINDVDFVDRMPIVFKKIVNREVIQEGVYTKKLEPLVHKWLKKSIAHWQHCCDMYKMLNPDRKFKIIDVYNTMVAGKDVTVEINLTL